MTQGPNRARAEEILAAVVVAAIVAGVGLWVGYELGASEQYRTGRADGVAAELRVCEAASRVLRAEHAVKVDELDDALNQCRKAQGGNRAD